jgi:glycosyltransferase involved in cell wall biosynthesis
VIRLCRLVSRSAEAVVYVSSASAAQHETFGFRHRRLEMIPNGFDVAAFKPDPDLREMFRAGIGVGARETVIGLFARYHPMKDHRNFFQAAARLVAEGRDLRMVLAGSGVDSENRELCTIIREMGLSERTLLLGERGDVAEIMPGLDILCMSSSHGEAFPLVLGEAMAAGVPCVATDLGDAARLVGDAGRIVPPREPEALATALGELIDLGVDERRTMGAIGRQRIIDNFSLDTAAGKYHLLYQELLAEWPPSQN